MAIETLTFGCRLNAAESDAMRALAQRAGLADTVIVNTCAVTAEAEAQARQAIRRVHREQPGARIVVTGCAAEIAPAAWAALPGVARVIGNAAKLEPASWGLSGAAPVAASRGRARALLQVQQGCDHRCSFCVIPFGRGASRSVPVAQVVAAARALAAAGHAELVLTGVDITAYGADLPGRPALGELVAALLAAVPEVARLRLSSLDPMEIDAALWRLIGDEPRLMPHLHLSVQHGDDVILKRMKRRHRAADVRAVAARARALRPGMVFGADLIAGFPTETAAQFAQSCALVREAGLNFLHVFPYSARPGTVAARMPPVAPAVVHARAAQLRALGAAQAAAFFASRLGAEEAVLLERADGGHTEQFAPLRLVRGGGERGAVLRARVTGADARGLLAEAA